MKHLLMLCVLLSLLSGCFTAFEAADEYTFAEILLRHEAVLEVEPVLLDADTLGLITEYLAHAGLEHREVTVYRIRYMSDAYEVMGYAAAPIDYADTAYPILIYNRGGNRHVGMLEPETIAGLASLGYIALGSQYRGVAGGTGLEQFGGDDINDVLRLIDISESFTFAQQGGMYMAGHSRGGMMTYIASRLDERIVAAAVWAAPSSLFGGGLPDVYRELIGGMPDELPEEFERRSAVYWADEINVPLLIGHGGTRDFQVLTQHSVNMAQALERYGKPHRLVIYPEAGHGFLSAVAAGFLAEMDEWFKQHPIPTP